MSDDTADDCRTGDCTCPPPAEHLHVTIPDPDDPHGSPAYDGPAFDAGTRLAPGQYGAATDDGDLILVTVHAGGYMDAEQTVTVTYHETRADVRARIVVDRDGYVSVTCTRCDVQLVDDDRGPFYDASSDDGTPHVCHAAARAADRLRQAAEAAEAALWQSVAAAYPEVTGGDLDPFTADALSSVIRDAVATWVRSNTTP